MQKTTPIVESNNFIILDKYDARPRTNHSYQSEEELETSFIQDLKNRGYEYLSDMHTPEGLLENLRVQIESLNAEALNKMRFSDAEWDRLLLNWLNNPTDGPVEQSRRIHNNYICDFTFDDGHIENIYLFDKKNLTRNKVQVIHQVEQRGKHLNRYDVTILVNGLPLVQVELKARGVNIREAFNQVHRYSKESFNSQASLFKYLQVFVISNGTDTRYFANTTKRNKHGYDFTMNWARADNTTIRDLEDFTETFFQKQTLLPLLLHYSVLDSTDTLLVMRPYQIAATERILWKIRVTHENKLWNKREGGGYVWHTTGSGKTLTSFKAALLATELDYVDKVLFVVDRRDLDLQTMTEYKRFSENSVNSSADTAGLRKNLAMADNKIVVTTIQKLNNLVKSTPSLPVYNQRVVFIFDECHRSQFGAIQRNITNRFKRYCQFGFTGTPIFPENALGDETTESIFGKRLHAYVITDAIRDEKVLKFKVDYHEVLPQFKDAEAKQGAVDLSPMEYREGLLHPLRIERITSYILDNFRQKTLRRGLGHKGFNALFAVSSVDAAKLYYASFKELQGKRSPGKQLKVATIFSFSANEEQRALEDECLVHDTPDALAELSAKEFLAQAISDYNAMFATSYGLDSESFQNYYADVSRRLKNQEIDLLVVVDMFLTGFDAPTLNTLFLDKDLRNHGLIQAYSRTNRIYDSTKSFGNIVSFRNLDTATINALALFANEDPAKVRGIAEIVLEKSYKEYMEGFTDPVTGAVHRGFLAILQDLQRFSPTDDFQGYRESEKKDFAKAFGEYVRVTHILQSYDQFGALEKLSALAQSGIENLDQGDLEAFQQKHGLSDDEMKTILGIRLPSEREFLDYTSNYNKVRYWILKERKAKAQSESHIDWSDVTFEVELLKSQEITLDYILELLCKLHTGRTSKADLVEEARKLIQASLGHRAKESLLVDFINQYDFEAVTDQDGLLADFYAFARAEQETEFETLVHAENLKPDSTRRYLALSLQNGYASDQGTNINDCMTPMSPLNPEYTQKKAQIFYRLSAFVDKYGGIGGFSWD